MQVARRDKLAAVLAAAAVAAAFGGYARGQRTVDPCEAHPATYACAMFAQPAWLTRRVYAGRPQGQPQARPTPAAAPASRPAIEAVEAVAVSADVFAPPIEHRDERGPDGV